MKAKIILITATGLILLVIACNQNTVRETNKNSQGVIFPPVKESKIIGDMLDSFNVAAAMADFEGYFSFFTDDATYMGTDATEYWNKKEFMAWSKPFFDKKTTWNFKSLERHINFYEEEGEIAWFDELLNTQMKICRGSGVVVKEKNTWKIKQYVLSVTIPNSEIDKVVEIKSKIEDSLIVRLSGK